MFSRKKIKENFMITIPEPCSEDWSKMKVVDDLHRHCAACERTLVDFSVMTDDELVIFFKQNNGKVCGRFRKGQMNRSLTKLPEKTSKAKWWKAAALLPLSLFSRSADAQQLPDSTQIVQTPMMELPDSASMVDQHPLTLACTIDSTGPWPFREEYFVGLVPWIPLTTNFRIDWTLPYLFVDSTQFIPHADSKLGVQAAVIASKKIPGAAEGSGFANNFHPVISKKEE